MMTLLLMMDRPVLFESKPEAAQAVFKMELSCTKNPSDGVLMVRVGVLWYKFHGTSV